MLEFLKVNPSSGDPIYKQLSEQITRLIIGGQLAPGETMPSVRKIAEFLTVNPMTVSRAINQLVDQGFLEHRRGQPTRVAQIQASQQVTGISLLENEINELIIRASQLGISKTELLGTIKQKWADDLDVKKGKDG